MASGYRFLGTERSLAESQIERTGIKPGNLAPGFTLPSVFGETISLDDYRGRHVLVVFSDPNCGPCEALAPKLVRLARELAGLQVLMVSRGDLEANCAKAHAFKFPFPVVVQDGWKLSREYGIFATPVAFLIDEDGVVAQPVAIGQEQILALAETVHGRSMSRWRALAALAAGIAFAVFVNPLRALAATCRTGLTSCGSACVDLLHDPDNCGACGHSCGPLHVCLDGACVSGTHCPSGLTLCSGSSTGSGGCYTLAQLMSSPLHCSSKAGSCGVACGANQVCVNGYCVKATPASSPK
jgi:peroxiredoxin